jgi:hypothetical protein
MYKKGTYEFTVVGNAFHFVLNCVRGCVVWPALIYSYLRSVTSVWKPKGLVSCSYQQCVEALSNPFTVSSTSSSDKQDKLLQVARSYLFATD